MKQTSKKIEHVWSILCRSSVIDSVSNNLSLNHILEDIQLTPPEGVSIGDEVYKKEKVINFPFEFITLWKRVAEGNLVVDTKVDILDPAGVKIGSTPCQVKIATGLQRLRFTVRFQSIKITTPGEYTFLIYVKEGADFKIAGKYYLDVKIAIPKNLKAK